MYKYSLLVPVCPAKSYFQPSLYTLGCRNHWRPLESAGTATVTEVTFRKKRYIYRCYDCSRVYNTDETDRYEYFFFLL